MDVEMFRSSGLKFLTRATSGEISRRRGAGCCFDTVLDAGSDAALSSSGIEDSCRGEWSDCEGSGVALTGTGLSMVTLVDLLSGRFDEACGTLDAQLAVDGRAGRSAGGLLG